jgi:hypothetical protein
LVIFSAPPKEGISQVNLLSLQQKAPKPKKGKDPLYKANPNELFIEYTSFPFIPIKKDFRWGPGRISSMSYVFSQMAKIMVHFCILFR